MQILNSTNAFLWPKCYLNTPFQFYACEFRRLGARSRTRAAVQKIERGNAISTTLLKTFLSAAHAILVAQHLRVARPQ